MHTTLRSIENGQSLHFGCYHATGPAITATLPRQLICPGTQTVIFMGNSTGCQDIAKFLSTRSHPIVKGGILQAPVSDREYFMNQTDDASLAMKALLPRAKEMIEKGQGWEIVPKEVWEGYGGRITWERFFSLMGEG